MTTRTIRTLLLTGLLALALAPWGAGAQQPQAAVATPGPGPQELMQQVSQALLRELEANRELYRREPAKLRGLTDRYLLPHFDTDYAGRMVLGKHWRAATPQQKQRFIDAFYTSMMHNYGDSIIDFTSDRLRFLPFRGEPGATSATVRTEVRRSDGTPVPVNYTLRATPQGWKAWDVTIEGISYVKNFRSDFGAEIEQKGIDAVIERLEAQNAANARGVPAPKPAGKPS